MFFEIPRNEISQDLTAPFHQIDDRVRELADSITGRLHSRQIAILTTGVLSKKFKSLMPKIKVLLP